MMGERFGWIGYCCPGGEDDLQSAAALLGALDELEMACDADELRRTAATAPRGTLGVIVGATDAGVSDVNLAAAVVADGNARTVVLVRRGASGSLRSRAHGAGIDLVVDPGELAAAPSAAAPAVPGEGEAAEATQLSMSIARLPELSGRAPVIAFCSGRGGVGKTTLVAVAAATAASWGMRVCALDLDLSCGNLHGMFGVPAGRDPVSAIGEKDAAAELIFSTSSGLGLTAPCARPEMAEVAAPVVGGLAEAAARTYDLVLVDTSTTFTDAAAQAAQLADRLVIVTDGGPASPRALSRMGGLAVRLGVARTRICRLENRANPRVRADLSLGRADVGLEAARAFRVFDGGAEVAELCGAGEAEVLAGMGTPFSRSVAATLAQLLSELGKLPDSEEAQRATGELTTRRWVLPFGQWREAR